MQSNIYLAFSAWTVNTKEPVKGNSLFMKAFQLTNEKNVELEIF